MATAGSVEQEKLAIDGGPKVIDHDLSREWPGLNWVDTEEINRVLEAVERRHGLIDELPPVLREHFGCKWACGINSGTGALSVSLRALGIGPGMEVLVPGLCWIPTFSCVVANGAIPVLVEVGEDLGMDPSDMERKITPRTRAVIVAHMLGAAANLDPIIEIARRHNLKVVEDCAQDSGGTYRGNFVGLFGDIGAFSLQYNKHATAYIGGFMLSNNEELGLRAELARDAGLARVMHKVTYEPGDVVMWGEGRLLNPLIQAMAAAQIPKLPKIIAAMKRSHQRIRDRIAHIPGIRLRPVADPDSLNGSFMVTYWPDGETAEKATEALRAEGVPQWTHWLAHYGTHVYYQMPMLVQKVGWLEGTKWPWNAPENQGSDYDYGKGALPQSDAIFAKGVVMAVPSNLTDEQCDLLATAYSKVAHHLIA